VTRPRGSPVPVLIKELSGSARRWQTYAFRGVHVALFLFTIWTLSDRIRNAQVWINPSLYAQMSRQLFGIFMGLQSLLVILAGISAASDLIVKEVRLGTLGLLVCTPLTPMRIACGKWMAAVAQTSSLLLCGAPVLAVCAYLGGASPRDLLCALTVSGAAISLAAALSLYCSSLLRTGTGALLVASIAFAVYVFGPILIGVQFLRSADDFAMTIFSFVHLPIATAAAFTPFGGRGAPPREAWIAATVVTMGAVWVLLRLTAARVAALTVKVPPPPLLDRAFEALDRFYEDLGPEPIRKVRLFAGSTGVWQRGALLWKELRTRASGRLRNSVRISLVLLLGCAFGLWIGYDDLPWLAWISTGLLWYMALSNGASLFAKEKEERKWDLLLVTPLASGEILLAKLAAGIVPVLPVAAAIAFFWIMVNSLGRFHNGDLLIAATATALPALLGYVLGAVCSLRSRSLRSAFTTALSGMIGVLVLLPLFVAISDSKRDRDLRWLSPFWFIQTLVERGLVSQYRGYGFDTPGLLDLLAFATAYGGLSTVLLAYILVRFDRLSGRTG
jgi:ABC-type transport system involved in multi-copper enzyme maturation permease subunit